MANQKITNPGGTRPDAGQPGGGKGRVDEVKGSGVYPGSGPYPGGEADIRSSRRVRPRPGQ